MARRVLLDEFHVSVYVPAGLPDVESDAIKQALDDDEFRRQLQRAVRAAFRRNAALAKAEVKLSR